MTFAANASVPFAATVPLPGVTATESTLSGPTVTVAVAVLVGSAMLLATTWNVPAVVGATYVPGLRVDDQNYAPVPLRVKLPAPPGQPGANRS